MNLVAAEPVSETFTDCQSADILPATTIYSSPSYEHIISVESLNMALHPAQLNTRGGTEPSAPAMMPAPSEPEGAPSGKAAHHPCAKDFKITVWPSKGAL